MSDICWQSPAGWCWLVLAAPEVHYSQVTDTKNSSRQISHHRRCRLRAKVPTQSRTIIILNVKCDLNQQRRFWPPFSSRFSIALPVFPILHRLDLTRIDVFSYLSISKLSKSGIPTWLGERSVLLVTRCKVYLLYIEHQKLRFLKTFFFLLNWFLPLTVSPLFISFKIHILFLTISPIPAIPMASLCTHSSLTRYRASHQRQNGHGGQSSIFRT